MRTRDLLSMKTIRVGRGKIWKGMEGKGGEDILKQRSQRYRSGGIPGFVSGR